MFWCQDEKLVYLIGFLIGFFAKFWIYEILIRNFVAKYTKMLIEDEKDFHWVIIRWIKLKMTL